jgi:hypothetical protein
MIQFEVRQKVSDAHRGAYLEAIRTLFMPAVSKQEGFVRFLLLEEYNRSLQDAVGGSSAGCSFVIQLSFETEELRQQWVATPEHALLGDGLTGLVEESTHTGFQVLEEVDARELNDVAVTRS